MPAQVDNQLKVPQIKNITFLGYADAKESDDPFKAAFDVAALCAQLGYTTINGAGPGIMKASTMGAHSVGGEVIGVTFYPKDIPFFEGRDKTNNVDQLIVEDNYLERTMKLLELGQAFVIFNGGTGTISEFGMAWGLARLHFGHHKPLILYGDFTRGMYIRPEERQVYKIVNKPSQVIDAIEEFKNMVTVQKHDHINQIFSV